MWSVLNAGPDTMDSAMKITINSRIFDAIVRLADNIEKQTELMRILHEDHRDLHSEIRNAEAAKREDAR